MTDADPYPHRRGGRTFAFMLAVFFLTVIGASAGFVLGRQHLARQQAAEINQQSQPNQQYQQNRAADAPTPQLTGTHCPKVSEQDAKRELIRLLYIKTSGSEVWICRDGGNGLWYQARNEKEKGFTNTNSILLPNVQDNGDGTYLAANTTSEGTTKYHVSRESFTVERPSGALPPEPVIYTARG